MFRRTFLLCTAAVSLAACTPGSSSPSDAPDDRLDLEVVLIDAQTPFGDTGKPYFHALREAGHLSDSDVTAVAVPPYGRQGEGATVSDALVLVADARADLEGFFDALPAGWTLPPSHEIRVGHRRSEDGVQQWSAHVVRTPPIFDTTDIVRVEAESSAIWLYLDRDGAERFESMTAANVGQRIAFVVDDTIMAEPIINDTIPGGKIEITLGEGEQVHRDLAARLAPESTR